MARSARSFVRPRSLVRAAILPGEGAARRALEAALARRRDVVLRGDGVIARQDNSDRSDGRRADERTPIERSHLQRGQRGGARSRDVRGLAVEPGKAGESEKERSTDRMSVLSG